VEVKVKRKVIQLFQGDITSLEVDAIVNAANELLQGGGGVDGAIHRAGGPTIMEECHRIGRCPPGAAVITGAGRLPAKAVIHTVGPIWRGGEHGEAQLLTKAYTNTLARIDQLAFKSAAFPSIGTGAYKYPILEASRIALQTVCMHLRSKTTLEKAIFALYSEDDYRIYENTLKELVRLSYCAD
jgi:O-acetyl-ADP-ribose deacetylase (regulator of RNase III)